MVRIMGLSVRNLGLEGAQAGAINTADVAVLQAIVLEGVVLVVIANFLADAFQARLDPRVRAAR